MNYEDHARWFQARYDPIFRRIAAQVRESGIEVSPEAVKHRVTSGLGYILLNSVDVAVDQIEELNNNAQGFVDCWADAMCQTEAMKRLDSEKPEG